MLLYLGWRLFGPLTRALPLSLAYRLSAILMDLLFLAWPAGRRTMRDNLRSVLRTEDPRILDYWAGRQLRRYGEYLVDAGRLGMLTPRDCLNALETDRWHLADAAIAQGPVIFAVMHFGNWDVAGGAFAARGYCPYVLIEELGHPALDAMVQGERARLGMVPVSMADGPLRIRRALREGAAVGLLFDRPLPPQEPGVDVTFCGRRCRLPGGLARLALASGARIIPLAVVRLPGRNFRFRPLLDFDFHYEPRCDRAQDVRALTQALLDVHTAWVRRYPDQWYQFQPFFAGPGPGRTAAPRGAAVGVSEG